MFCHLLAILVLRQEDESMYCLCSNKSFDEVLELQRLAPLPFDEMLKEYTFCCTGCGSCIEELRKRVTTLNLLLIDNCVNARI